MPPTTRDSFSCWDGFDVLFDKAFASPATPSQSQSELAFDRHAAPEPRRHYPQSSSGTTLGPSPLDREYQALNQLWETIRQRKEREMAKSPPKVKSLETPPAASPPPASVPHKPAPKLKRRKSDVTFREAKDGRTVTATFDLPGIKKPQVHVSFRENNLVVNWETVKVTEKDEGERIVREREEKKFTRTIPLPEGTKFEEVRASMDGRHLILTYPNMRSVRVEPRRADTS